MREDLEHEVLLFVPHETHEVGACGERVVHLVAAARVFGDRMPPVAGDEVTVGSERGDGGGEPAIEVGPGPVAGDLRQADVVAGIAGPVVW